MATSTTLSIRVPKETKRWLERFAKRRSSAGMAATRVLEEARRREYFPAVEFRDTPLGRMAYAQGTRVQVAFVHGQILRDSSLTAAQVAGSFRWPLWKAAGVLGYIAEFRDECAQEWDDLQSAGESSLKRAIPGLERVEAGAS